MWPHFFSPARQKITYYHPLFEGKTPHLTVVRNYPNFIIKFDKKRPHWRKNPPFNLCTHLTVVARYHILSYRCEWLIPQLAGFGGWGLLIILFAMSNVNCSIVFRICSTKITVWKHKESNITNNMKLSDEDKKEPLKMEMLETKYVNMEKDKDDEWTNI